MECLKTMFKIFVNPPAGGGRQEDIPEAYAQQARYIKQIWDEDTYGLERIVRLALCLAQFLFPVLLIRDIFGKFGTLGRRLAVEFYTVIKFVFPLVVLWQ